MPQFSDLSNVVNDVQHIGLLYELNQKISVKHSAVSSYLRVLLMIVVKMITIIARIKG